MVYDIPQTIIIFDPISIHFLIPSYFINWITCYWFCSVTWKNNSFRSIFWYTFHRCIYKESQLFFIQVNKSNLNRLFLNIHRLITVLRRIGSLAFSWHQIMSLQTYTLLRSPYSSYSYYCSRMTFFFLFLIWQTSTASVYPIPPSCALHCFISFLWILNRLCLLFKLKLSAKVTLTLYSSLSSPVYRYENCLKT